MYNSGRGHLLCLWGVRLTLEDILVGNTKNGDISNHEIGLYAKKPCGLLAGAGPAVKGEELEQPSPTAAEPTCTSDLVLSMAPLGTWCKSSRTDSAPNLSSI